MDIFVSPLKVVNNSLISELLLENENILEEIQNALFYIKMIEFSNHGLLIFKIPLVLVDQGISLIDNTSDVIEN